jgi:phytoene/squalene synthetase
VRLADEIVDSFHDYDKVVLLKRFEQETWTALDEGISLNPVLQSFQETVNHFNIDRDLIKQFLNSMEMDLKPKVYNIATYQEYIYGSAEVVGLMCLKVFVSGDDQAYHDLKPYAIKLGSAFQKVNFLRDIKDDLSVLGRTYFPNMQNRDLDHASKAAIIDDISDEMNVALHGIQRLPASSGYGVYLAYKYYLALLKKLKKTSISKILNERIRVNNFEKSLIFVESYLKFRFLRYK